MRLAMICPLRIAAIVLVLALASTVRECGAQTPAAGAAGGRTEPPAAAQSAATAEIIRDLSRLPPRAARMRERILEAARSGDPGKLLIVMQSNETLPVFSF